MLDAPVLAPRFETVAGLSIRCADGGVRGGETFLLTSPHPESVYAFERVGRRWRRTPTCWRSTCRGWAGRSSGPTC